MCFPAVQYFKSSFLVSLNSIIVLIFECTFLENVKFKDFDTKYYLRSGFSIRLSEMVSTNMIPD